MCMVAQGLGAISWLMDAHGIDPGVFTHGHRPCMGYHIKYIFFSFFFMNTINRAAKKISNDIIKWPMPLGARPRSIENVNKIL